MNVIVKLSSLILTSLEKKSDWLMLTLYSLEMLRDTSTTSVHIEEMAP